MVDEDPKNKKSKFISDYLSQRESEHQKVFAQPASTRPVEPATAYPWSRPLPAREERNEEPSGPSERPLVRDLALKRARPYLRPDQETGDVRPSVFSKPEPQADKYPSPLAKRRPGFKLVREGLDAKVAPPSVDAKKKRLCLYDLYAPRMPSEDGTCPPAQVERPAERSEPRVRTREEPASEEPRTVEQASEEPECAGAIGPTEDERDEAKDLAASLLWGGSKKKTTRPASLDPRERPILKTGPGRKDVRSEPKQIEVTPAEDVRMVSAVDGTHDVDAHEEAKGVEPAEPSVPESEGPKVDSSEEKGAGGEFCISCGTKYTDHLVPQICTGCGAIRCTKCNQYDHEHVRTSIYYDYKFDWPLCISCYSKAFSIQKQLSKALICYGNGNMTYALYYSQNAIRMDPNSKYVADAERLIGKIDQAKIKRESIDKAWRDHSQKISRAKYQDPGWQQQQQPRKK